MRSEPIRKHELVFSRNCSFGEGFKAIGPCNLYNSHFGEDVQIGPFVEVGGAKIGDRTKISSHSYICPDVFIGRDCFIAHGVYFCNDNFQDPKTYNHMKELESGWKSQPTIIGNCVRIGSGSVLIAGIKVGDHAVIGAGSVITKDVPPHAIVMGVPAKQHLAS